MKELVAVIKADFKTELLADSKIQASNTRAADSNFGPQNVIDGNKNTYWATDDKVKQATIEFTFKKPKALNRTKIKSLDIKKNNSDNINKNLSFFPFTFFNKGYTK